MLLCLLLTSLVGKSYASTYTNTDKTHKTSSANDADQQAKLDIYQLSVEAIVPFLHLEVPQYYCVLFEIKSITISSSTPVIEPLTTVQEQYFKTLFQDIISPNAP